MSEQKMREALERIANLDYTTPPTVGWALNRAVEIAREALAAPAEPSGSSGEFAAPAGEQVGLTDAEVRAAFAKAANPNLMWPETVVAIGRAVIAAHEAKKAGGKE